MTEIDTQQVTLEEAIAALSFSICVFYKKKKKSA